MSIKTSRERDRMIEQLRKQLEVAETAKKAAEKAELAELRRLQKLAGEAHSRAILTLYDMFDIEPEHPMTRIVNGKERSVTIDRDEKVRTARLLTMVEGLIEATAGSEATARLVQADQAGRDERKPRPRVVGPTRPATPVEEHHSWAGPNHIDELEPHLAEV